MRRAIYPLVLWMSVLTGGTLGCGKTHANEAASDHSALSSGVGVIVGAPFAGSFNAVGTLYGDYLRGLAELRLATAEADYRHALAAQEWAKANMMWRFYQSLARDLTRLDRQLGQVARFQGRVAAQARRLNGLQSGNVRTAVPALRFFMNLLPSEPTEHGAEPAVILGMQPVSTLGAEQFVFPPSSATYNRETKEMERFAVEPTAFPGGSMLAFLDWLQQNSVKVVVGSPAHEALLQLREQLQHRGTAWTESVRNQVNQVREQLHGSELWNSHRTIVGSLPARRPPNVSRF